MNLVEKLLKVDPKKTEEKKKRDFSSERLGRMMGLEEPVQITLQEIGAKRMSDLIAKQVNSKGNLDPSKVFDVKTLICVDGIINPDVKDEKLMEHFNCSTPKDLVIKLFGGEINAISDELIKLSDYKTVEDTDDEVKN